MRVCLHKLLQIEPEWCLSKDNADNHVYRSHAALPTRGTTPSAKLLCLKSIHPQPSNSPNPSFTGVTACCQYTAYCQAEDSQQQATSSSDPAVSSMCEARLPQSQEVRGRSPAPGGCATTVGRGAAGVLATSTVVNGNAEPVANTPAAPLNVETSCIFFPVNGKTQSTSRVDTNAAANRVAKQLLQLECYVWKMAACAVIFGDKMRPTWCTDRTRIVVAWYRLPGVDVPVRWHQRTTRRLATGGAKTKGTVQFVDTSPAKRCKDCSTFNICQYMYSRIY